MSPDLASRGRESRRARSLHDTRSGIERQIESDSSYFPNKIWNRAQGSPQQRRRRRQRNGERRWLGEHRRTDEEHRALSTDISRSGDVSETL
ncbi:unnamed protein product [Linum trigynum]|uniref:Uncharacterized protein n=1 Tax=Linum trigynum TaxID=586398 RepID=A0AAV2FBS4_9ROSI